MSRRARVAALEAVLPDDLSTLCCLEHLTDGTLTDFRAAMSEHLRLDPGDSDPPLELPVLPFGGVCLKTGGPLCEHGAALAQLFWERRRRLAVSFRGIDESDLDER